MAYNKYEARVTNSITATRGFSFSSDSTLHSRLVWEEEGGFLDEHIVS